MADGDNEMGIFQEDDTETLDDIETDKINRDTPTFDFTEQSWRTDFVLNVEGTKLYVAKSILSLASPVFDRMFQSEFKESRSEELTLPGKTKEEVTEFLRCIYPNCLLPVSYENALRLLPLVDEYQVIHVKTRCEQALVENVYPETPIEDLYQRLREADLYNLKSLREKCIRFAAEKTLEALIEAKNICKPPAEDWVEILEKVSAKMAERLENLSIEVETLKNLELGENAEEYKASNAKISEEFDIAMNYIAAEVKKSKELQFDENLKWEEMHVVLTASAANQYFTSTEKELWGVPLQITTSLHQKTEYIYPQWCYLKLFCMKIIRVGDGNNVSFKINTRCDIVNMQPEGENISVSEKTFFTNTCKEQCIDIKKIEEIISADAGFVHDGKIAIIVHLYMSKPNKC